MIRETAILPDFPDYHGFWGFDPGKSLFFDIETSGLSAASSHVFLIGTICRTEHGWQLTQYLAERTSEEPELLAAFLADAAPFSTLIHFNGTTFDLPYINARARACHLPILYDDASDCIFSIDLYQKLRRLKKLSGYAHMKQKDLEAFAGWQREDTLTGRHLIAMFHAYEKTSDPELRRLMLLHTRDDLVGMTRLLPLAAYLMLAEGRFAAVSSTAASASHGLPLLRIRLELAAPLPRELSLSIPCPAHGSPPFTSASASFSASAASSSTTTGTTSISANFSIIVFICLISFLNLQTATPCKHPSSHSRHAAHRALRVHVYTCFQTLSTGSSALPEHAPPPVAFSVLLLCRR